MTKVRRVPSKDTKREETVRVWDAQSGECLMLTLEDSGSVLSVALSDDGTRIVSGSSDMTVRVWDLLAAVRV